MNSRKHFGVAATRSVARLGDEWSACAHRCQAGEQRLSLAPDRQFRFGRAVHGRWAAIRSDLSSLRHFNQRGSGEVLAEPVVWL
jgi:hypothetical protein